MSRLDLGGLGEHGFLRALRRRAESGRSEWRLGIGDDAAILKPRAGFETVISTDSLVEGVHFRWGTTSPRSLGRKALLVSLSDVGAMGARPIGCLLNLSLPGDAVVDRVEQFFSGFLGEARRSGCPLIGGDTVRSTEWNLAVTVLGQLPRGRALLRSAARAGDRVLVTGNLGHAALGLGFMERGRQDESIARPFVARQRLPGVPWRVGSSLAKVNWCGAAIDVSDGLIADLGHICAASDVGADLQLRSLPRSRKFTEACNALGADADALLLAGGEDYQLLFTVRAGAPDRAAIGRAIGATVREVGCIRKGRGIRVFDAESEVYPSSSGFDHFKSP